jgi:hypothetical protein
MAPSQQKDAKKEVQLSAGQVIIRNTGAVIRPCVWLIV